MKVGIRKPNYKKRLKARTTGKIKRQVKKAVIPGYGKKGTGWIKDPKKAAYNKVYNKTTVSVDQMLSSSSKSTNASSVPNSNTDTSPSESVLSFESIPTYLKARISPSLFTLKRNIHYLFKMDFAINPTRFPYVTYSHLLPFSSSS